MHLQCKAAYRVDHRDCMLVYDSEGRDCSVTCLDWTDYLLLGDMTEALTTILCDTFAIETVTPFSCDALVIKVSLLCDTYGVLQVLSKCFWTDLARQRVQQTNWSKWCGLLSSYSAMAMQPFVKNTLYRPWASAADKLEWVMRSFVKLQCWGRCGLL